MTEYLRDRLELMTISKKHELGDGSTSEVSIQTREAVPCALTILPEGVPWEEVTHRRMLNAESHAIVEDWIDVRGAKTDDLHRPMSHYRTPAIQLEIQYRLDSSATAENQADLTESEGSQLRGAIAGMNWAARQARPDMSAAASIIASSFPTPKESDAKSANKAIKSEKERQFDMVLWSFREEELRRICVEDSAFDPLGKDKSQHGYLIGYTTPGLAQGENAPVSIVSWKSKKLRRKANSSLLCESMSGNISVAHWLWLTNLEMSLRYSGHRHGDRLVTTVEEEPTVLTKRVALAVDPQGLLILDAKSLYDVLHSQQTNQDDARSALEAGMIKEDLEKLAAMPRWVPHDKNPADAMTKHEGSHATPLIAILEKHHWRLTFEEDELKQRAEVRETLGYNPRPRHSN